ncbi:MAG: hypothetical protein A2479_02145 [Candidatus Magasanikbacteria bacterium RIFOXYC2_FULL_39_8]|nr:MAG: hypothetical protein A2479_02145 [Candidatus Magasanikbacteria bacterium RIFOXYC2_FULL_39_8]
MGVIFVGVGGYSFLDSQKVIKTFASAQGTVVELVRSSTSNESNTYSPLVSFVANETEYQFKSNFSSDPPAYDVGEQVNVLYNPESPQDARINSFLSLYLISLIFGVTGLILLGIGAGYIAYRVIKNKSNQQLKMTGRKIDAVVKLTEQNTSVRVNRKSPYVVYAEGKDPQSGAPMTYKSENIWDASKVPALGIQVSVYVDQTDLKKYYVDIE